MPLSLLLGCNFGIGFKPNNNLLKIVFSSENALPAKMNNQPVRVSVYGRKAGSATFRCTFVDRPT
jgi:hypothetical protein